MFERPANDQRVGASQQRHGIVLRGADQVVGLVVRGAFLGAHEVIEAGLGESDHVSVVTGRFEPSHNEGRGGRGGIMMTVEHQHLHGIAR